MSLLTEGTPALPARQKELGPSPLPHRRRPARQQAQCAFECCCAERFWTGLAWLCTLRVWLCATGVWSCTHSPKGQHVVATAAPRHKNVLSFHVQLGNTEPAERAMHALDARINGRAAEHLQAVGLRLTVLYRSEDPEARVLMPICPSSCLEGRLARFPSTVVPTDQGSPEAPPLRLLLPPCCGLPSERSRKG